MLAQRDLTSTFAENLLKQFEKEDDSKSKLVDKQSELMTNEEIDLKTATIKCESNSTMVTEAILKNEIKSEPILKIEKLEFSEKMCFNNRMTAKEILEATRSVQNECT